MNQVQIRAELSALKTRVQTNQVTTSDKELLANIMHGMCQQYNLDYKAQAAKVTPQTLVQLLDRVLALPEISEQAISHYIQQDFLLKGY